MSTRSEASLNCQRSMSVQHLIVPVPFVEDPDAPHTTLCGRDPDSVTYYASAELAYGVFADRPVCAVCERVHLG